MNSIQPLIVIKSRKKEKSERRDEKGARIDHMTERQRRQNLRSVAVFLCKAQSINKIALN